MSNIEKENKGKLFNSTFISMIEIYDYKNPTTSNSLNATASMKSVSPAFRHWAMLARAVNRKITSEVGRRLITSASWSLLSGSVKQYFIKTCYTQNLIYNLFGQHVNLWGFWFSPATNLLHSSSDGTFVVVTFWPLPWCTDHNRSHMVSLETVVYGISVMNCHDPNLPIK